MKLLKILIAAFILPLVAFTSVHKYYISVTQINYVQEKESVQIISRIFIDDLENALQTNYDEFLVLSDKDEAPIISSYLNRYLQEHLKLKINDEDVKLNFIGKEYEGDIVRCYLEVEGVTHIDTFSVTNSILFDLFDDQKNIIKTKINSKNKSVILSSDNPNALLKFN
ncbi:DUF6702 family protein [Algibacter luteus]|jgi:hypothetical protein|uniref:Peptidase E n=1 Tax=Algibacter luteus TaxID=1178825 RepID=A0A1M6GA03_9FLAO|nr:DUF6702 family protein [Algibacter luteus]SHJ06762.1 hypothetical protein SAMN05216261_2690 [Algibacter luteus]